GNRARRVGAPAVTDRVVGSRPGALPVVLGCQHGAVVGADGDVVHRALAGGDDGPGVRGDRHARDGAGGDGAPVVADHHVGQGTRAGVHVFGRQHGAVVVADGDLVHRALA